MKRWTASASCFCLCYCHENLSCGQGRVAREAQHLWSGRPILADSSYWEPRALRSWTEPEAANSDEMIGRACPPDLRPPVGQHISSPLLLGTWIQLSMACLWPGISCSPEPLSLSHSHLLGGSGQNIQPMAYCQPETLAFCLLIHYLILTNPVTDPHRPQSIEGEWHPLHSTLNINPRIFTYLQSFIYSADFYWLPAMSLALCYAWCWGYNIE